MSSIRFFYNKFWGKSYFYCTLYLSIGSTAFENDVWQYNACNPLISTNLFIYVPIRFYKSKSKLVFIVYEILEVFLKLINIECRKCVIHNLCLYNINISVLKRFWLPAFRLDSCQSIHDKFKVRVGTWNVGTLKKDRNVNICYGQETIWKGKKQGKLKRSTKSYTQERLVQGMV